LIESPKTFWSVPFDQLCDQLETSANGLTESTAQQRLLQFSDARLVSRRRTWLAILVEQFDSPIIWLLFGSAVLSFMVDDSVTNAAIILFILVASGLLGYWQEWSADDAVAKLLEGIETHTTLLRDGQQVEVLAETVVPGDIVVLTAGGLIPCDCRIVESKDLFVDEAALTGESYPVEKSAGTLAAETSLSQRTNSLFLGTHVVSGMATAVAVHTGRNTEFGRVSERLEIQPPESGFEKGLRNFGNLLIRITLAFVTTVFVIKVFCVPSKLPFFTNFFDSLKFALALAVGMTPQLLPAITSVVLSEGAKSMARSQVIVKRLLAIENFGGMNILCSDKTGTLTDGKVRLHSTPDLSGNDNERVLRYAYVNATLQSGFENPIDHAIRTHQEFDLTNVRKVNEVPYDFFRKRLSVLVDDHDGRIMITKGALMKVLDVCTHAETSKGQLTEIASQRPAIDQIFTDLSNQGYRVLGVARRSVDLEHVTKADECDMTFLGYLVLYDPPKPGVLDTVRELERLGVGLKIITGDNRAVTAAISRQVGLTKTRVMTGHEMSRLSDEELSLQASDVDLFAEVEPNQKERIILALKRSGNIVGYMGDGINDASALHAADVGISVEGAVDVAREAAQIVLLKQDLSVLIHGVEEGRKTLANTLKYVFVSISGNFGYMFSLAVSSLFLDFEPLLPSQILLINLLADFPAMALATDRVDPELIAKPRRWDMTFVCRFMLVFGLSSSLFDFLTFGVLLKIYHAGVAEFRTIWFIESVISGILMMMLVRTQRPFLQSRPGKYLSIAALVTGSISVLLPFSPFRDALSFMTPPVSLLVIVAAIAVLYAGAMETAKWLFYRSMDS
jgi:Mg2+-importing ATPase